MNKQITEDYVSFEIAKLLKEKGFKGKVHRWYTQYEEVAECTNIPHDYFDCPTFQMALKWLREVHKIFIEIYLPSHSEHEDTIYHGTYSFDIFNLNTKGYVYCTWNEKEFKTYEEAIEAALKYTLENLI